MHSNWHTCLGERKRVFFAGKVENEATRLTSLNKGSLKVGVFGDFKIAGTSISTGEGLSWRITTTDQITGLQHEYFVDDGEIYQVQFQTSPPWSHQTSFIVGRKVKRILDSEKRATLEAVASWS